MNHKAECKTVIDLSCKACTGKTWSDKSLLLQIESILEGIDQCETDYLEGWWETDEGARYGSRKLEEIRNLFN